MKERIINLKNWVWKNVTAHKIMSIIILLVVIVGGYYGYKKAFGSSSGTQYVLGTVVRGNLVTTVTGTGQVAAEDQVDIKPQGSSQSAETMSEVDVKQGDTVKAGQLIAVVDNSSAKISLAQAQASVMSAQANYNKVVNGATSASVAQAQLSVDNDKQNLAQKIKSSYTTIAATLLNNIDPLYLNATSFSPQFDPTYFDSSSASTVSFLPYNSNQTVQLSLEMGTINNLMTSWNQSITSATSSDDLTSQASTAENNIQQISSFLNDVASAVNSMSLQTTKYNSTLNGYKSNVASAQSAVNGALNDIISAQQSLESAEASFNVTTAPARPEDIETAKAQLLNAQNSLASAEQNYNQSFLRAPFDGVIAQVNVSPGDQASTATVVATIITKQQIAKISLNEVDAANVQIGQPATLTFDAIPGLTISGTVAEIDTIGTVTQGVVTYNAKIAFNTQDDRVKPGMSSTVVITTGSKDDVLLVPSSAVKTTGNRSVVQVLDTLTPINQSQRTSTSSRSFRNYGNGTSTSGSTAAGKTVTVTSATPPRSVPVIIGESNDTETEIVSGLTEGEQIVVRTISGSASSAQTTTSSGGLFGGGNRSTGANAARAIPR